MRYSSISAAILALTSSVFAQTANFDPISVPTQDQQVAAGSSLDITWEPSTVHTGPITIQLLQGATPSTLEIGETIKAAVDQTLGKYTWAVPADLKSFATYGFKITLDSTATDPNPIFQFSFPFHITGLSGASSSGYSASATGGTTTIHLSTGTGYTAKPTTSSSTSVNSTSTYAPSTTSSVVKPTTYSPSTSVYPTGNITLSTTFKPSSTATPTGSSSNSTSTTPPQATSNSAVNNMARGGFAVLGGLVLAFAL